MVRARGDATAHDGIDHAWPAVALGVLASRAPSTSSGQALSSTAASPGYQPHLSWTRGKPNVSIMLLAQSAKCRGVGGWPPRVRQVRKNRMSQNEYFRRRRD